MTELANVINELEEATDKQYSEKEKRFAVNLVKTQNKTQAAKEAGCAEGSAGRRGYEMANDPDIQRLINEIEKYSTEIISEDFIKKGILKESLNADSSKDRLQALQLLGKTKAMFTDVVEQTNHDKTDEEIIEDIRREFGEEAAEKAKEALGE
jgi:phage terminase small subunit